jgi:hypothetical protein
MRQRGRVRLVALVVVAGVLAAGCTAAPAPPDAASSTERGTRAAGPAATPATSEEASPSATPAASQSEDADQRAVLQARDAAWQAWIDSVSPPRADPEHPALQDTHTGGLLLHVIRRAMDIHDTRRTLRHRPGSSIDVQSVTFADDTTAWLETCLVVDVEDRTERGKVLPGDFFQTGTTTTRQTDVMRKEDGTWKLAESIVHHVADGRKDCAHADTPGAGGDDLYSEATIARARAAADQALVDLVNTKDCCALRARDLAPFAETHTGHLLNEYRFRFTSDRHLDQPVEKRAVRYFSSASDCVSYPGTGLPPKPPDRKYSRKTYALFDAHWEELGDTDPQYGSSSAGCLRIYNTSIPFGRFASGSRSSSVVVQSVTIQASTTPTVAYIDTCRLQRLEPADGAPGMRLDNAIIRATESLHAQDGTWKLAGRWDIAIDEYARDGCE